MYRKMVPVFVVVCVFGFSVCAVVLAAAAIDMSAEEQITTMTSSTSGRSE